MDVYNGGSLKTLRGKAQVIWDETILAALIRGVCRGLVAIHGHGWCHRDIKPDNILMDGEGRAHIGDLGIAVKVPGIGHLRQAQGTTLFMAPEVFYTLQVSSPRQVD